MTQKQQEQQVLEAAAALVKAFASNDRAAYFGAFTPEASFIFYNFAERLPNRDAYQQVWDRWRAEDGFEVLECVSSNATVSVHGEVAVFIHDVATELRIQGERISSHERETIVFTQQQAGHWLASHEHLSSNPQAAAS